MKKIIFLILIFIIFGLYFILNNSKQQINLNDYIVLEKIIEGNSMSPLLKNAQKILFIVDYYKYNSPTIGDIVGYDYGGGKHMYIKQIKADGESYLKILGNTLIIDEKIMTNSVGEVYYFTVGEQKLLNMFIHNGYLPKDSYFIFGDNVKESIDSRRFGAISKNNLLGKFIIK